MTSKSKSKSKTRNNPKYVQKQHENSAVYHVQNKPSNQEDELNHIKQQKFQVFYVNDNQEYDGDKGKLDQKVELKKAKTSRKKKNSKKGMLWILILNTHFEHILH